MLSLVVAAGLHAVLAHTLNKYLSFLGQGFLEDLWLLLGLLPFNKLFDKRYYFCRVADDADRPMVFLADGEAQPVLFKDVYFFCPSSNLGILHPELLLIGV